MRFIWYQTIISSYQLQNHASFTGTYLSGPSDTGGSCPSGSGPYSEAGIDYCCCGGGCCWDKCNWSDPPDSCIAQISGASWVYNSSEGYFQACVGCG